VFFLSVFSLSGSLHDSRSPFRGVVFSGSLRGHFPSPKLLALSLLHQLCRGSFQSWRIFSFSTGFSPLSDPSTASSFRHAVPETLSLNGQKTFLGRFSCCCVIFTFVPDSAHPRVNSIPPPFLLVQDPSRGQGGPLPPPMISFFAIFPQPSQHRQIWLTSAF